MQQEEWRPISGYEGLYDVSSQGRVRSWAPRGRTHKEPKILVPISFPSGYHFVGLWKDHKEKTVKVSRLVAQAFIPNPDNLPCVNHKDENKGNNCVDNLEWCDVKYNSNYGTRNARLSTILMNREDMSHSVQQFDLDGNLIATYPSIIEAHRQTGADRKSIMMCCAGGGMVTRNGKRVFKTCRTAKGYVWKLA